VKSWSTEGRGSRHRTVVAAAVDGHGPFPAATATVSAADR
jgi:hypothetical protein